MRVAKIRSNLHTGQYAGGVPSDHGQRQALVEPLSLPRVAWNVNKFLSKTAREGASRLAVHTSGFDCKCNWLKVTIVKNVIVFPAFAGLSISCYTVVFIFQKLHTVLCNVSQFSKSCPKKYYVCYPMTSLREQSFLYFQEWDGGRKE